MDEELTPQAAEEAVSLFRSQEGDPPEWDWLAGMWNWFQNLWSKLGSLAAEAASWVWSYVGPWFESIWSWITTLPAKIWSMVGPWFESIWDTIQAIPGTMWEWVGPWLESIWGTLSALPATIWARLGPWLETIWNTVAALPAQITDSFAGIPRVITKTLADPITDWLSGFMEFLGMLLREMGASFLRGILGLPYLAAENFGEDIIHLWSNVFAWVGKWGEQAATNILESILGYVQKLGRVDPTNAPSVAGGLMSLMGTGVFGLCAMTIAGELMHPLKEIGMGHVSAMIGDVINYRVISGAFMGALVGAALTTPLRYYFNYTLRPWLPDRRVIDGAMSRDLFTNPEKLNPELAPEIKALVGPTGGEAFERRMLGYHGFADEWYPVYKELANSRVGYFALAAIARIGTYDDVVFDSEMRRAGYWSEARTMLLDMYRREALGESKALYIGDPINAFKEGWFSEERLSRELIECGIPEANLPRYLHAAWIKYEVDLLSDRLAGLKEAYRKGLVKDQDFRDSLTGWGMADERATEHLRREQIRRYGKP